MKLQLINNANMQKYMKILQYRNKHIITMNVFLRDVSDIVRDIVEGYLPKHDGGSNEISNFKTNARTITDRKFCLLIRAFIER